MHTTLTLSASSIERLNKNARLFSYVMTAFTKTYCCVHQDNLIFYFKGPKSLMSFRAQLEDASQGNACFSIDITKLLSALRKLSVSGQTLRMTISDSPANITVYSNTTNDKISFSANFFDEKSPEITSLVTFFTDKEPIFSTNPSTLSITPALLDFAAITGSYMSTINKNNAIVVDKEKFLYADRTIVVKRYAEAFESNILDDVKIHKFILGFMEFVINDSPTLLISQDGNFVYWESAIDNNFKAILVIDPCVIGIPSDSDIAAICPEDSDKQTIECVPASLIDSIEFFSGLFEASIWKPITFNWSEDKGVQRIQLSYKHPSTEILKDLANYDLTGNLTAQEASFTLISDSLKILLTKSSPQGKVKLHFNEKNPDEAHGAGILVQCFDENSILVYEAVLAKLSE